MIVARLFKLFLFQRSVQGSQTSRHVDQRLIDMRDQLADRMFDLVSCWRLRPAQRRQNACGVRVEFGSELEIRVGHEIGTSAGTA
ncbi:hypothetical protein DTL21_10450 [Bremerella cremea]|uniref:Uncharacterized protein n=1 Tax=Blastopirellula marina TaxID=124 RepID=A0A2S8FW83_9BACT|nr:hypothetical protein C5Y83_10445 [Blastopirellula marina]RCS48997.1 hypothetical protein DTL21_10450 [Bremerella cremea]